MVELDKLESGSNAANFINNVSIGRKFSTFLSNSIDHQSWFPFKNNFAKPNFNSKLDSSSTCLGLHICNRVRSRYRLRQSANNFSTPITSVDTTEESPPSFYNGLGTIYIAFFQERNFWPYYQRYEFGVKVRSWESVRHPKPSNPKVGFPSLCLLS